MNYKIQLFGMVITFLIVMGTAKAGTVYNCTQKGEIVVIPDCPLPECPPCPEYPNQTVVIKNLTLNTTCVFTGFEESYTSCMESVTSCRDQLIMFDDQTDDVQKCDRDLNETKKKLDRCESEIDIKIEETKEEWKNYVIYAFVIALGLMYFYYQDKLKAAGRPKVMER